MYKDSRKHGIFSVEADASLFTIGSNLDSLNIKDTSKSARLRALKAMLSKCLKHGWVEDDFWKNINIKPNRTIKPAASQKNIEKLIKLLDKNTFVGFRDTVYQNASKHSEAIVALYLIN